MHCKYKEDKLQALTKMDVTYEWSDAWNLHNHVCHKLSNELLDKLFLLRTTVDHHNQSWNPRKNIDYEQPLQRHVN